MTAQPKPTAAEVLGQHQMTTNTRTALTMCTCGAEPPTRGPRGEFGRWLRQHQEDMLAAAGLLATADPLSDTSDLDSLIRKRASRDAFGTHDVMLTVQFDAWLAEHDREVESRLLRRIVRDAHGSDVVALRYLTAHADRLDRIAAGEEPA